MLYNVGARLQYRCSQSQRMLPVKCFTVMMMMMMMMMIVMQVKKLKVEHNTFVMVVAIDNPDWVDSKQIDTIASTPFSLSVFKQRQPGLDLAQRIHSLICDGECTGTEAS